LNAAHLSIELKSHLTIDILTIDTSIVQPSFFFARQQGFTPLQQANEQIKIESLFSKRASKEKINQDLLMQVMEMGFSELRSEKAAKWLEPMAKKCS
jgi:hypothetical protein